MRRFLLLTLLLASTGAFAYANLVAQWVEGGNRYCKYSDGTVIKVGVGLCPLSQ